MKSRISLFAPTFAFSLAHSLGLIFDSHKKMTTETASVRQGRVSRMDDNPLEFLMILSP